MTQPVKQPVRHATPVQANLDMNAIPDPDPAAFFHFTRYNADVSLLIGHVNIPGAVRTLHEAAEVGRPASGVPVRVTHQFHLSLMNFYELREKVEQFAKALEASGIKIERLP